MIAVRGYTEVQGVMKEHCWVQARCKVQLSQFVRSVIYAVVGYTEVQEVSRVSVRKICDDRCCGLHRSSER